MVDSRGLGGFIYLFIALIMGLVLVSSVSDQTYETSAYRSSINSTLTLAGGSGLVGTKGIRDVSNLDTGVNLVLNNGSNFTIGTNNYNYYSNGSVILKAGAAAISAQGLTPSFNSSYSYFGENYVKDSTSRIMMSLIVLFLAVTLVAVGI
jgi:hypothetical protein